MKAISVCFLLAFLLAGFTAGAQNGKPAASELRPALKTLLPDQKQKLLRYMQYLGSDLDRECLQVYEQLSPEKRKRVMEFIEVENRDPDQPAARTMVTWNRDTVRFGNIPEGTIVLDSFTVTNRGSAPYLISNIRTNCDCTVVHQPEFPVMPGETATLRIEFDSKNKSGLTQPGIIVYDNSIPNQRSILYLKGIVVAGKEVERVRE
jgi:hypothetical protein